MTLKFFSIYHNIQIMPGLEGDLEEWQTQEVNVTRGEAEGDIDLEVIVYIVIYKGYVFNFGG